MHEKKENPIQEKLHLEDSFRNIQHSLENLDLVSMHGRITEVLGVLIKAILPHAHIGEIFLIKRKGPPLFAEVVGFTQNETILSPFGEMFGISHASEVEPFLRAPQIKIDRNVLGRVLNGLGEPIDTDKKGPLKSTELYPVINDPPNPLKRKIITQPITTGVRCIDGILTCGEGQRIGIFASAGSGKSTLLGMIARYTQADVNVIVLIGERGREVLEFIKNDLGNAGAARSVIVVSTSNQSAQLRINAAHVGTAIAEYFRDHEKKRVMLLMDSITRYARAHRDVGLAKGEPPTRAGFPPSFFSNLPKLLERSGNSDVGSITAFYTVLVTGGDPRDDPVADEAKSLLDGHFFLSDTLAHKNHYPAIDVLSSISRVANNIISENHRKLASQVRKVIADYQKNELLIRIGEYKYGSDKDADFAIKYIDRVNRFLQQRINEGSSFQETLQQLGSLFK